MRALRVPCSNSSDRKAPRRGGVLGALCATFAAGVLLLGSASSGAEPVRVIVVSTGAGDPVAARLIDELITSGATVEVMTAQTDIPTLGRGQSARAVVRVDPSRRAVRVWLSDAAAEPQTITEEPGGDADAAARSLALRVVEVLRPHLERAPAAAEPAIPWPPSAMPAPSATPSATPSAAPSAAPTTAPSAPPPSGPPLRLPPPLLPPDAGPPPWPDSLSIYVAPAILLQPTTSLSAGAGALWGFTKLVWPSFGVDICALVPVLPAVLTGPGGQVKVMTGAVGAGAFVRYPQRPSVLTGWLGVGLAAGFVGYDAEATSASVRASDGVVAHALPYARAAAEWRAWPSLGLRADLFTAIARPRPVLEVAGLSDTILSEPLVGISLGAIVWVP